MKTYRSRYDYETDKRAKAARKKRLADTAHQYTAHPETTCVYCGDPATGIDHVPGLAQITPDQRGDAWPCCKDCNITLRTERAIPIDIRRQRLLSKTRDLWQKYRQSPADPIAQKRQAKALQRGLRLKAFYERQRLPYPVRKKEKGNA